MACPPEAMKPEQAFLALLGKVRYAEATRFKLTLKDSDDNVFAELIRWDPD
jgi:heat shock protein HslJ